MKYFLIFLIGWGLAKLDSKYGAKYGFMLGEKTRSIFIGEKE